MMRPIFALAAIAATFSIVGCQSCSTHPAAIVGDSMSHWGPPATVATPYEPPNVDFRGALTELIFGRDVGGPACGGRNKYDDFGCQPCNVMACGHGCGRSHGGPCSSAGHAPGFAGQSVANGQPSGGEGVGCGGQFCAGTCGGQCAVAQSLRALAALHAQRMQAHHAALANMRESAHRLCAYGSCGGRPGPEQGAVSFPYYTVRGPRDFLATNPPSIGP